MFMKEKNDMYFTFLGKKYAFDINALLKVCLISNEQNSREKEITNVYNIDGAEEDDLLTLTSKVERELKTDGNPQNDVIAWDFMKILIEDLINKKETEDRFTKDFSTSIVMNTLIKEKIIVEI